MKTFEKFIASNLFRKRKELPREVKNLGHVIRFFLNNHIDPDWSAFIREHQPKDKKNDNIIYISIDPNDLGSTPNFVNLYYNSNTKELMIAILPQPNCKELVDIQNFLEYIIKDYNEDRIVNPNLGPHFFITIDKIPEIAKRLNSNEFELFINANKYNV